MFIQKNLGGPANRGPNGEDGLPIHLQPGEALVYRGCEVNHWRRAFAGIHQVQVFLHYVDQNGLNAEYRLDKRPMLGVPAFQLPRH